MNTTLQKLCASCGVPAIGIFVLGLIVCQFLPVPGPSMSADEVAAMYQDNTVLIRTGAVLVLLSTLFTVKDDFFGFQLQHFSLPGNHFQGVRRHITKKFKTR